LVEISWWKSLGTRHCQRLTKLIRIDTSEFACVNGLSETCNIPRRVDALIWQASKEELAEVGRVPALKAGHCRIRFKGVISLELLTIENVAEDMATTSASSCETPVKVLKAPGSPQE
jgi:hypothetical protein